ncbi:MAG: hypothetical protein OXM55_05060 [Bdellovibrionales bacterium]|nr:hypothetical protein [Bdellovibrionales bacterium]
MHIIVHDEVQMSREKCIPMKIFIKKRKGIFNRIIPIGFLFLFVLVSCSKSTHAPLSPSGELPMAVHQEMKQDLSEEVQKATRQFTAELSKALAQATTEFRNHTENILKKRERKVQVKLDKEALTSDLDTVIQNTRTRFTSDINTIVDEALSQFRSQVEGVIKENKTDAVTLEEEANKAISWFNQEMGKTIGRAKKDITEWMEDIKTDMKAAGTETREDVKEEIKTVGAEVRAGITDETVTATLAMMNMEIGKITNDALSRFKQEVTSLIQDTIKTSDDPMTKARNKAQFIIQSVVKNLRLFLDRELLFESASGKKQGLIKQIFEDIEIKWEQVVTEQDKTDLADKIISTIYSDDEQYKHGLKNINTALMINLKNIKVPEEDTVMLTVNEKRTLTNEFSVEIRRAVENLIKEQIRYNVDKIIDVETAPEAVYTLQFDVESSLPHKIFGKPIQLFISMRKGEDSQNVVLWRKGDCIRIKKEHLPSITLVLLYTNPAIAMNVPNPMFQLCDHKEEKYRCQPGNYNIQQVGEEEGIDYVLRWEKLKDNNTSSCQVFPNIQ